MRTIRKAGICCDGMARWILQASVVASRFAPSCIRPRSDQVAQEEIPTPVGTVHNARPDGETRLGDLYRLRSASGVVKIPLFLA